MKNITISFSKKVSSMDQLHKQIMQFKNWLRGAHQKCADVYLFTHAHEYEYRFSKRNMRKWLFNDLIGRMTHQFLHPYQYRKTIFVYNA